MWWPWNRRRYERAQPRRDPHPSARAGFSGTSLTLYLGRRDRRAQPLPAVAAPPPAKRVRKLIPAAGWGGRQLTTHVNLRDKRLGLHLLRRRSPLRGFGLAVLAALKWLLVIRFRILIIERYIWGECFGNFILGTMGFTFFMIITSIFSLGEKIFTKNIPPFTVTKVLILSAPAFLVLAIPVAVVFSTLMAMGRLNRDNEIMALTTNGVSLYRIFVPFFAVAMLAGYLTWAVYEHVVPPNNKEYKEVLKVFWESQVVDYIKPQIVIKAPQRKYFYVDRINKTEGEMYNLRLYDFFQGENSPMRNFPRIFTAERAWIENKFLVLANVKLYNLDQNRGNTLVSASMPQLAIDIGTRIVDYPLKPHPTELRAADLRDRVAQTREHIKSTPFRAPAMRQRLYSDWTEYYFKFAIPFACIALVLVAVPVSLTGPRDERNLGLIMTFGLVMAYYIVFFISRTLGGRGLEVATDLAILNQTVIPKGTNLFPPYIAGWLPSAIFLVAATVLFFRARK